MGKFIPDKIRECEFKSLEGLVRDVLEEFDRVSNNTEDKPISNGTLLDWCKKIGEMIGVESLHCHDFRHSGATLLKNKGMALEDVSALLNHSGTDVTKRFYIKEDTSRISQLKDKFNI